MKKPIIVHHYDPMRPTKTMCGQDTKYWTCVWYWNRFVDQGDIRLCRSCRRATKGRGYE